MKRAQVRDKVSCQGKVVTIDRILYQDYWDRFGWDIEFVDTENHYRHWKQYEDGGELIRNQPLMDTYGVDCTDLFRKYGYKV